MALLTQYVSFFVSPFGEKSVADELNAFLRSHRIINVDKRLIDGERGTGWVFLVEYGTDVGKNAPNAPSQRVDYREVLNPAEYALRSSKPCAGTAQARKPSITAKILITIFLYCVQNY